MPGGEVGAVRLGRLGANRAPDGAAFRAAGFVLTLVTSCGLASLHFTIDSYPDSAGGVLGTMVGQGLAAGLSFLGATLLMLALWLAGVSLFAGVSWIEIMDKTGRATLNVFEWLTGRISHAWEIKAGREVKEARSEVIRDVVVPSALPETFTGIRLAVGMAYSSVVAAELFNGIPGIGGLVKDASNYNNTPVVLVGIFAIGISGLIIDGLLRAIERRAVPWRRKI